MSVKVTLDNLEAVADWCKGSIKGIKLPREEWVVDFNTNEGEQRAKIGYHILTCNNRDFVVVAERFFK